MADDKPTLLEQLSAKRTQLVDKWGEYIQAREVERAAFEARTDLTDDDVETFRAAEVKFQTGSEKREADIKDLDERIRVQKDVTKRKAKAAVASQDSDVRVVSEPLTYREDNKRQHSYFRDLAIVSSSAAVPNFKATSLTEARERLFAHAAEMNVELPKIAERRTRTAERQAEEAEAEFRRTLPRHARRQLDRQAWNPFEQRIAPNRLQGEGGYFVPPLWLGQYIAGLRPGRVTAGLCRQMDLPPGTDSINVPKLSTLTLTGVQGADNQPVVSQDFTDTAVTANVKTITGQEDVAIQLLDQSPYYLDDVLLTDLLADYDKQLDLQVIQGSGPATSPSLNGGSVAGLYSSAGASNWTGYNGVTYTQASPAPWHMFSVFGAMQSNVAKTRFFTGPSFSVVLHPSRALWVASGSDSQNRPLVESRNFGPLNVDAIEVDSVPAEGQVMQLPWGPRVFMDANMPTNDSGASRDVAIAAVFDDAWLFEGEMRTRVLPEVLSGTLQVRIQVYNYFAFLVRYGQSIAIASGTGFAAPTAATAAGSATTF